MDYATLIAEISVYAQQVIPAADFTTALPLIVNNGELRCLRDLAETLNAHGQNTTLSTTATSPLLSLVSLPVQVSNPRVFQGAALAYANPVVVEQIDLQVTGLWVPLLRVSLAFLNAVWPGGTTAAPTYGQAYFAMLDDVSAMIAPTPAAIYPARVTGWWRPATLSSTNTTTFISTVYSDLLFCACMIEVAGYQANYSAVSDNPQQALSWTGRYQNALQSARAEEAKRMGLTPPAPAAAPQAAAGG